MIKKEHELNVWLWLCLPVVLCVLIFGSVLISSDIHDTFFAGELGIIELATPIMLVPAIISGFVIFINREKLVAKQLGNWILLITIVCIYFAGEEISWGQQLVGWETPEWIKKVNSQNETNLHNMSSWFDQKPRLLLEISVLIGGIFLPLKRKFQGVRLPRTSWQYWLSPTIVCLPAAIIAILSRLPDRIEVLSELSNTIVHIRCSEVQELYFAMFLMIYLLSIRKRLDTTPLTLKRS